MLGGCDRARRNDGLGCQRRSGGEERGVAELMEQSRFHHRSTQNGKGRAGGRGEFLSYHWECTNWEDWDVSLTCTILTQPVLHSVLQTKCVRAKVTKKMLRCCLNRSKETTPKSPYLHLHSSKMMIK